MVQGVRVVKNKLGRIQISLHGATLAKVAICLAGIASTWDLELIWNNYIYNMSYK